MADSEIEERTHRRHECRWGSVVERMGSTWNHDELAMRQQAAYLFRPSLRHEWIVLASDHKRRRVDVGQFVFNAILQRHLDGPDHPLQAGAGVIAQHDRS